ncbi:MAG: Ig-like domain repeat protein, partial [Clostridia bacterium]|nr:Ig-like domain repeat protein [Clostridia bacterium]
MNKIKYKIMTLMFIMFLSLNITSNAAFGNARVSHKINLTDRTLFHVYPSDDGGYLITYKFGEYEKYHLGFYKVDKDLKFQWEKESFGYWEALNVNGNQKSKISLYGDTIAILDDAMHKAYIYRYDLDDGRKGSTDYEYGATKIRNLGRIYYYDNPEWGCIDYYTSKIVSRFNIKAQRIDNKIMSVDHNTYSGNNKYTYTLYDLDLNKLKEKVIDTEPSTVLKYGPPVATPDSFGYDYAVIIDRDKFPDMGTSYLGYIAKDKRFVTYNKDTEKLNIYKKDGDTWEFEYSKIVTGGLKSRLNGSSYRMNLKENGDLTFYYKSGSDYYIRSYNLELRPPDAIAPSGILSPNSSSWTKNNVAVVFDPNDTGGSGVKNWRYRTSTNGGSTYGAWSSYTNGDTNGTINLTSQGTYKIQVEVYDNAENKKTITSGNYYIDKTKPTVVCSPDSKSGWTNQNIDVRFTPSDIGGSGIKLYKEAYSMDGGNTYGSWYADKVSSGKTSMSADGHRKIKIYVEDNAGNTNMVYSGSYYIDKTLPGGGFSPNSNGWTKSDISVVFKPSDAGGSGVKSWRYRISNNSGSTYGTWSSYTNGDINGTISLTSEGNNVVQIEVYDNAGNISILTSGIYDIDKTLPLDYTVTPTTIGTNSIRINVGAVNDSLSGLPTNRYSYYNGTSWIPYKSNNIEDITGLEPNNQYTFKVRVIDNAGNVREKTLDSKYTFANEPSITVADVSSGDLSITEGVKHRITINSEGNPAATEYKVERATNDTFNENLQVIRDWSTSLTADVVVPSKYTTYYYRVNARNGENIETTYSEYKYVPGVPNISATSGGLSWSTVGRGYIKVTWPSVDGATSYDVMVYDGNNYRAFDVGTNLVFDTRLEKIYPTEAVVSGYADNTRNVDVFKHDKSGLDLRDDPNQLYKTSVGTFYNGISNYSIRVIAKNAYSQSYIIANYVGGVLPDRTDIDAPTISVTGNPVSYVNSDVTLSVTTTETESGLNTVLWQEGNKVVGDFVNGTVGNALSGGNIIVGENKDITIYARDNVGNERIEVVSVTKIDKVLPVIKTSGSNIKIAPNSYIHEKIKVEDTTTVQNIKVKLLFGGLDTGAISISTGSGVTEVDTGKILMAASINSNFVVGNTVVMRIEATDEGNNT